MIYRYRISGLNIMIDGTWPEFAIKEMSDYEYNFNGSADITVKLSLELCNIKKPDGKIITCSDGSRYWMNLSDGGIAFFDYTEQISSDIINLVTLDKSYSHVEIKLCKSSVLKLTEDIRPYVLLGEMFKLIVLTKKRIVFHSSAIKFHDKSILFSAASGTGKSTHTSLWQKYYPETVIINDDAPIIIADSDEIVLSGSPWSGTSCINKNISAPLAAIVFLKRAHENSIQKIDGSNAVFNFLNEVYKPYFPEMTSYLLDNISIILKNVPAYILNCDMSRNAVETVKKKLNL